MLSDGHRLRWWVLVALGMLLAWPAWAEVGTCYTAPLPITEADLAGCDLNEPDCSVLPEVLIPQPGQPAGPRCLEAGPTCSSGDPLMQAAAGAAPLLPPRVAPTPRRPVAWRPGALPLPLPATPRERATAPPTPPPRA